MPPADGLSLDEPAALAHEEQRRFVVLLESRDMGSMQVDLRGAPGSGDFKHGQFALAVQKGHAAESFGLTGSG